MIAIADAGVDNLRSVEKAFEALGHDCELTTDPRAVARADRIVVPGQGAFGDCMAGLARTGLAAAVSDAIAEGKPYLGICLGLEILFAGSEESGGCEGLGIFAGRVVRLAEGALADGRPRKVPHMGWNQLGDAREPVPSGWFYFAHSFHVVPDDADLVAAWTDYGERIVAAVARGKLCAVQFHPEKSQRAGLSLLDRFARSS